MTECEKTIINYLKEIIEKQKEIENKINLLQQERDKG